MTVNRPHEPRYLLGTKLRLITDASYADGIAGIAVTGDLGEFAEAVPARSSSHAEELAMLLAMGEVYRYGVFCCARMPKAEFVTDYNPVTLPDRVRRYLAAYRQWKIVAAPRTATQASHSIALRTMRCARNARDDELPTATGPR